MTWARALLEHAYHPQFTTDDNARDRTLGFCCTCTTPGESWQIPLTQLRRLDSPNFNLFLQIRARREQRMEGTTPEEIDRLIRDLAARVSCDTMQARADRRLAEVQADNRAEVLLQEVLAMTGVAAVEPDGSFIVASPDGRRYRIERGAMHNVVALSSEDQAIARLCVISSVHIPTADLMLGQALLLRNCPEEFLRLANLVEWLTEDANLRTQAPAVGGSVIRDR